MDKKLIIGINSTLISEDDHNLRQLSEKNRLLLGSEIKFLNTNTRITSKIRDSSGEIKIFTDNKLKETHGLYYCQSPVCRYLSDSIAHNDGQYIFVTIEGSDTNARIIFTIENDSVFDKLIEREPTLSVERLVSWCLPPTDITVIDSPDILNHLYAILAERDDDLYSIRIRNFIRDPHILTQLFAQVMNLSSADQMDCISYIRTISDEMRNLLTPFIKKVPKNHSSAWKAVKGVKITYADGGMSRVISLPNATPMGIRVGFYSVNPGELNQEMREQFQLQSYVIGDVLNDTSSIEASNYVTDIKRLQEAARYILEPLSVLRFLNQETTPSGFVFIHGPLVNSFETYNELPPNFVPGVDKAFLESCEVFEVDIKDRVDMIPEDYHGNVMWSQCIPMYLFVLKEIFRATTPVIGVVERTWSHKYTRDLFNYLVKNGYISSLEHLWSYITKYEIRDEFLFGCILEEGEYVSPIPMVKNYRRRAQDKWQPVVEQFPVPEATMLKTNGNKFPYRVELPAGMKDSKITEIMSILYHASLLLPNYAFPVGIDIADKYAKIPDWLSRGISANLTASILAKVLQTGNDRLLRQVRQLLARSPRDFFFRPEP